MANGLFDNVYNPDVLSCLANLSNDEVFTPPEVVNQMLDMLPQELFRNPDTTFLDPACKTGVFLREIAKRLIVGLEPQFPDLQERLDHIFHNQLYGIAITELTSMLSRRGVYCSKFPHSEFSVSYFDEEHQDGNIRFKKIMHTWDSPKLMTLNGKKLGKCVFCGATRDEYDRPSDLETHAYEWLHTHKPEEIFNMKFDVIIGNPPYQLSDGGNGVSAKPIYNLFVEQAKKLNPRFLIMITPSRWFNGGKGLDKFRNDMFSDRRITRLVDYQNAKDCFPGVSIGGGVSYFLWERDRKDDCEITNIVNGREVTLKRPLDQFPVFVRYNDAIDIIRKVQILGEKSVVSEISPRNPFGIATSERGKGTEFPGCLTLISSKDQGFISRDDVTQGKDNIDKYKIMISRVTSEHAGEPDKDGMYKVISKIALLSPGEVCTDSYIVAGASASQERALNFMAYLKTKFVRFLILQTLSSINLSRDRYEFVPQQDFSKTWDDESLYKKYNLTPEEVNFIEATIKPMES